MAFNKWSIRSSSLSLQCSNTLPDIQVAETQVRSTSSHMFTTAQQMWQCNLVQTFGRKPSQFQKLSTEAQDLFLLQNTRNISRVHSASPMQWAPHVLPRGQSSLLIHLTTHISPAPRFRMRVSNASTSTSTRRASSSLDVWETRYRRSLVTTSTAAGWN